MDIYYFNQLRKLQNKTIFNLSLKQTFIASKNH